MDRKLQARIAELERQLAECQARYEGALAAMAAGGSSNKAEPPATSAEINAFRAMHSFTVKQHCAMQMMLRGSGNAEIADRMGVQLSTAKVYVRAMFAKLGVRSRAEYLLALKPVFDRLDPAEYERMGASRRTGT